jgi:hypothetical protein
VATTRRTSTWKASRKPTRKTSTTPARRRGPQFKRFDHVTPEVETKPLDTFVVDFRFFGHVEVQAVSLDDAFAKAKDLTVVTAWQSARKHRTQIAELFTPDHAQARTRAGDIGP